MNAITLDNISKSFEKIQALDQVTFNVKEGELFGLIGPDGAGKTTLFRILTTLMLADSGVASVMGNDVEKDFKNIRKEIGYMPGKFSLYQDLTVEENLNFFATLFGTTVKDSYDLIKDIYSQIEPFKKRRAGKLSGGMKQKLALSCTLVHKPKVLFLDEPTTGVDAVSRKEFWEILQSLKAQGITILVSTPYMDEALQCERIALIQKGKIMQIDSPQGIIQQYPKNLYAVKGEKQYQLLKYFRNLREIESVFAFGESLHITLNNISTHQLKKKVENEMSLSIEIKKIQPNIEDVFIRLTHDFELLNP